MKFLSNKQVLLLFLPFLFLGCASKSVDIMPKKVSNEKYNTFEKYSCNQIDNSLSFLEKKAQRLARVQNDNANSDRTLAAWGWLYGVSLLFMEGDGAVKKEFEEILGEKEALEEIAIKKDCNFNKTNVHHTYEGNY